MSTRSNLPPGQFEIAEFPRFGLTPFAVRFPADIGSATLRIAGDVRTPVEVGIELQRLERVEQCCDFHCVTTWTRRALTWGGVRFADFYRQIVVPLAGAPADATFVVLRGQDGARSSLPLDDLLAPDVLLADRLDGQALPIAHGAPLRLVAPGHYGYKSVKHVNRIEFWRSSAHYRPVGFRFMDHPRARVANEERGQWIAGWILRYLYRPLIRPTAARFERALQEHLVSAPMRAPPGTTPLHAAALRGDRNAVRQLLDAGADPNAVDERGCAPLHEALKHPHLQVARMLVAAGGQLDTKNRDGVTPRQMAHPVSLWEGEN